MSNWSVHAREASSDQRLRKNNFDLLRFVFAFVVFLVHAHVLSGAQELAVISRYLSSDIAVKSFFVVSGFLIFMSYESSRSVSGYFGRRIRRIYPAYAFVILATAVLGSIFSGYGLAGYLSLPLLKYLAANLLFLNFLQPDLPGLEGLAITAPLSWFPGAKKGGPGGQVWNLGCGQYVGATSACALDDAPYGALIGRVGPSGDPFLIGDAASLTAPASGYLYLTVNDNLGSYSDNLSGFTVLFGK